MKIKSQQIDEDYELLLILARAREAIMTARENELKPYGISPIQAGTLYIIDKLNSMDSSGESSTPANIAIQSSRKAHSTSELLTRMGEKGLINKDNSLEKANRVRIELTDKGLEVLNKSSKRTGVHNILSVLSEQERQQLSESLRKIEEKSLAEIKKQRSKFK